MIIFHVEGKPIGVRLAEGWKFAVVEPWSVAFPDEAALDLDQMAKNCTKLICDRFRALARHALN